MKKNDKKLAVLKQKKENKLLAMETKEIEERLKLLKSTLYSELTKTNKLNSSVPIWKGSCPTSSTEKQKNHALVDISVLKFKPLKHSPTSEIKSSDTYGSFIRRINEGMKLTPVNPVNAHQSVCGQCEDKNAVVLCQECSEYYCTQCFAMFHLKGALRRHHSLPVSTCSLRSELRPCKETDGINKTQGFKELISKGCQSSFNIATKSNSALQTEAINDSDQYDPPTKTPLTTKQFSAAVSHITSTLCKTSAPIEIYFTPSITYAEKLLLRLHRNSKLQQSISQDSVSEGTFLPNSSIEQEKKQEEAMENFTLNRNSFDELHKLATTQMQLSNNNPHVFSHFKLDSEEPINQIDKIMYPIIHESDENYSSIPFFDESLCNLIKQKENTDQIHNGQCSQINDEDGLIKEIHENNEIIGSLNNKQNIWRPVQSLINPDSNIIHQISKTILRNLNLVLDEQSLNNIDLQDSFLDDSRIK
ncbi:unnamed protein product [Schistosoma mattheei]|uniref:B box-type domain-containing protein n=1 Tax=Schistosoma mattheei TaxID=31246 RepID=A0AA85B7F0_9TREM|nr:unnamed protein product [Schistosoma mattheei]